MTANDGLWLFLAVTWLRVSSLLVDFSLMKKGLTTLTEFARRNEWFAFIVLAVESIGVVGLGYHFFASRKE